MFVKHVPLIFNIRAYIRIAVYILLNDAMYESLIGIDYLPSYELELSLSRV